MNEVKMTGQTVEEAIQSALTKLGISKEEAEIEVVDQGKKGFLGFGARPASVIVKKPLNPIEEAKNFLLSIMKQMDVDAKIEVKREGKNVEFQLSGEKIALVIGKRGQTLNALQSLTQLVLNRYSQQFLTIILDAENYRAKRKETLENLAAKLADKALRTNRKVALEPMPSYERKIIHAALMRMNQVETFSEGQEPGRHIVIAPKKNSYSKTR